MVNRQTPAKWPEHEKASGVAPSTQVATARRSAL